MPQAHSPKLSKESNKTNYYSVIINVTFLFFFFFNFLSSALFLFVSVVRSVSRCLEKEECFTSYHEEPVFLRPKQKNIRIKDNRNRSPI